jgi:hypothetical protein
LDLPKLPAIDPKKIMDFAVPVGWGISNPARFRELMMEAAKLVAPGVYFADNLFTWCRNISLFEDVAFRQAWEANIKNDADRAIAWRRYILASAACHCVQLAGDFVECGVYWGTGVKTVVDYLGGRAFPKTFWAYDTFDHNPVQGHAFADQGPGFHERVVARFAGYEQVKLVKGTIPEVLRAGGPSAIALLHLDLNSAAYEVAALDCLFDKVVAGGIVVLDDYEWAGPYRGQKIAEDRWFEQRNYRVMPLPTGQGLVFKR